MFLVHRQHAMHSSINSPLLFQHCSNIPVQFQFVSHWASEQEFSYLDAVRCYYCFGCWCCCWYGHCYRIYHTKQSNSETVELPNTEMGQFIRPKIEIQLHSGQHIFWHNIYRYNSYLGWKMKRNNAQFWWDISCKIFNHRMSLESF